ncbi:hypothetical protein FACS18949_06970 [Clostridia bacterium]|nr:hypothetical protein FACS189425_05460 [Clostridia bacterium]GHV33325.1 hypothetical protein FACS18949_06970 [Clostridia bacterium]
MNRGLVAEDGDWTYISLYGISRENKATSEVQLISIDDADFLNVIGDWVYYCNKSDDGAIYKIRTDGTERTKISDEKCKILLVVDDYCYYGAEIETVVGDSYYYSLGLCKIRTDGTDKTVLFMDGEVYWFALDGAYIYFSGQISHSSLYPASYGLYRMKPDGSEVKQIYEGQLFGFQIAYDKMYFSGEFEETGNDVGAFARIDITGSDFTILGEYAESYNIVGDWVFYAEDDALDNSVYKMRTDGSEKTLLYDNSGDHRVEYAYLNIANEWLYLDKGDWDSIKIRFDGSSPNPWLKSSAENEYFSLTDSVTLEGFDSETPLPTDTSSYFIDVLTDDSWDIDTAYNAVAAGSYFTFYSWLIDFDKDGKYDGSIAIETTVPNYQKFSDANFIVDMDLVPTNVSVNSRYGWNLMECDWLQYIDSTQDYGGTWNEIYSGFNYEARGKDAYIYKGVGNIGVHVYSTYINEVWNGVLDETYKAVVELVAFSDESGSYLTPGYSPVE